MKRFAFSLERVLSVRCEQARIEETKLEEFAALRCRLAQQAIALREKVDEEARAVLELPEIRSYEFEALASFRRWTEAQCLLIRKREAECDAQIAQQRVRVSEARQRQQLIERLRERQWSAWQSAFHKDLEEQAAESYLARWNRERSAARRNHDLALTPRI